MTSVAMRPGLRAHGHVPLRTVSWLSHHVVNGIASPSVFVRHCAYWAAASYPPSALSAAAHVPRSAVVFLPEATSGWLDAEQRPGLHQCTSERTDKLTHDIQTSVPHHRLRGSPAPCALMVLTPSLCNGRLGTSLPLRKGIFLFCLHICYCFT